jgi:hypothetical protein
LAYNGLHGVISQKIELFFLNKARWEEEEEEKNTKKKGGYHHAGC